MDHLLAARLLMGISLGFHIIFAAIGIGMPLFMVIAEGMHLRTKQAVYLTLAKRWARGTAILFAVGAVSGTVLSFELGLLWPGFMTYAGSIIGMPFSLEGFAFFAEAIFLGIYLYGWDHVPPRTHWIAGVLVLVGGTLSGIFVVTANAWMNTPAGFDVVNGHPVNIRPFEAMWNPAAFTQTLHMTVAAFQAVGFLVAGVHAYGLLKAPDSEFHRRAFTIALIVAAVTSIAQPLVGDLSAKHVAEYQPIKLAALEGQWQTEIGAPLRIGGLPNAQTETTPFAIEIPYGLSFLAYGDPQAKVLGLSDVPPADRPPVAITHIAFQLMVALGFAMMGVGILGLWMLWRTPARLRSRWYLWLVLLAAPMGLAAIEAGWIVTEVGRQPWIIYQLVRTADAVTPVPGVGIYLVMYVLIYLVLGLVTAILLTRYVFASIRDVAADGEEVNHYA